MSPILRPHLQHNTTAVLILFTISNMLLHGEESLMLHMNDSQKTVVNDEKG